MLIPIFLFLGGVGLDLGWYYLNVSRLQNAADASVLVGARSLLDELKNDEATRDQFAEYNVTLVDKYPANRPHTSGTIPATMINNANTKAFNYARKNLEDSSIIGYEPSLFSVAQAADYALTDNYTRGNQTVTMQPELYQDGDDYFYVVHLSEDIHHFFIGFLDDMSAPVVAVAKISYNHNRKIVFNANGGMLVETNGSGRTVEVTMYIDELLRRSDTVYAAVPSGTPGGYSDTPQREGYEFFRFWTDKPVNGTIIPYAYRLTEDNVNWFFTTYDTDGDGTITLYAQWKPTTQDPWTINFDTNGGAFYNGDRNDSKNIERASAMGANDVTDPITPNKGTPERDGWEFKGWSTDQNADANSLINYIPNGKQLTKSELEALFGNNTSVTLYAVWKQINSTEEVKPHNNKTLWEQMQYLIAKNVYNYYWYASVNKFGTNPNHNSFINPRSDTSTWKTGGYYISKTVSHGAYDLNVYYNGYTDYEWQDSTNGDLYWDGSNWHIGYWQGVTKGRGNANVYYYGYTTTAYEWSTQGYYEDEGIRNYYTEEIDFSENFITDITQYYIDFHQSTKLNADYKVYYDNTHRVHSLFNVNKAYDVRESHKENGVKKDDDPIYCRIESEPYVKEYTPIRQIVININESNLDNDKRPLFFFYDGPDASTSDNEEKLKPENAKPVILNLNADFKGVLFMPDVPVVINGNGHKFEGFIVAKEYYYLDTTPTENDVAQVFYSTKGNTTGTYTTDDPQSAIRVKTSASGNALPGDVCITKAEYTTTGTQSDAYALFDQNKTNFGLDENSTFRKFKIEDNVKYTYVFYGYDQNATLDETPFHEGFDKNKKLIPISNLDEDGNPHRITQWSELYFTQSGVNYVKLFGKPRYLGADGEPLLPGDENIVTTLSNADREPIRRDYSNASDINAKKGTVLLDSAGNPKPLYDEAGNPIYFCDDYIRLTGTYEVLTLDRVDDQTRDKTEFLLKKNDEDGNISNTENWE